MGSEAQDQQSTSSTVQQQQQQQQQQQMTQGIDMNVVSQAMLQSGLLGNVGNLDPQTLAALCAGGGVQPNALAMLGMQPELLGLQSIPGLPAAISPLAMAQAIQMLKAMNPGLDLDNDQLMQLMNQSGFGMVAMPTEEQQQQLQQLQQEAQSQVKISDLRVCFARKGSGVSVGFEGVDLHSN